MSADFEDQQLHSEDENFISKSQIKRELRVLKVIAQRLLELKSEQINQLTFIDNSLRLALEEGKRIKSFNAKKRHLGFIAKLLQNNPVEEIKNFLDLLDGKSQAYKLRFHQLEQWRDRLLSHDTKVVSEIIADYPNFDRQHVNQLVRNAVKEQELEKPPISSRKLFRYLKSLAEV